jgi:hypothetical protein
MKNIIITAAFALMSATSAVSASPWSTQNDPNVLVNIPTVEAIIEQICMGCISPSTGRPSTNYVRPHIRSNGAYVGGYYRS